MVNQLIIELAFCENKEVMISLFNKYLAGRTIDSDNATHKIVKCNTTHATPFYISLNIYLSNYEGLDNPILYEGERIFINQIRKLLGFETHFSEMGMQGVTFVNLDVNIDFDYIIDRRLS